MAYPKITARVAGRHEVELDRPPRTIRTVTLRLRLSNGHLIPGESINSSIGKVTLSSIEVPAEYLPQDVMVGDEFEFDFFHVRRPQEAADAVRQ
jgi:hypothetical protein